MDRIVYRYNVVYAVGPLTSLPSLGMDMALAIVPKLVLIGANVSFAKQFPNLARYRYAYARQNGIGPL